MPDRQGKVKKMETTLQIPEGMVVRVYRKGFGYSIITVLGNNQHFLAALCDEDFFTSTGDGETVDAYLWQEGVASYEFPLVVIGRTTRGTRILLFSHTERIASSVNRKCLMAKVDIPAVFFISPLNPDGQIFSSEKLTHRSGVVVMMSDREIILQYDAEMPRGELFYGKINIDEEIELIGVVEGKVEAGYSILLSGIPERTRQLLLDYVFRFYRE